MDRQALTPSLWDEVDAALSEIKVRHCLVGPVSTRDVDEFCKRYHYTATGGNMMWRWGLWHGVTLLGVVSYNLPTRETCESVFGPDHFDKVWHMGRLALSDEAPHNSESRLIAGSLRLIQKQHPDTWGVLTYAATDVGHVGYVYQATNAIYTGSGGDTHYYTDPTGKRRSTFLDGRAVPKADIERWGWARSESSPKHRYLYVLGNKTERRERMRLLRLPSLPYPKGEAS